ncbi:hypothetical protein K2173_017658 [Erythroxylum novogranatense]|uniref:Uncharacterized protein n=1 Tax=Erythroxylum novogranatense TaxID=1862640 RepID=A0AAV8SM25_9ROSI|nr:hypothetical protein K2173_017658 [Erythroxylum novogranatense]
MLYMKYDKLFQVISAQFDLKILQTNPHTRQGQRHRGCSSALQKKKSLFANSEKIQGLLLEFFLSFLTEFKNSNFFLFIFTAKSFYFYQLLYREICRI